MRCRTKWPTRCTPSCAPRGTRRASVAAAAGGSVIILAIQGVEKVVVFSVDDVHPRPRRGLGRGAGRRAARSRSRRRCSPTRSGTPRRRSWSRPSTRMLGAGVGPTVGAVAPPEPPETRARATSRERGRGNHGRTDGQTSARDRNVPQPASPAAGRIVVDRNRNMLLFRGSGKEWAEIRSRHRAPGPGRTLGADRGAHCRSHPDRRGAHRASSS